MSVETVTLVDDAAGTSARILPGQGFNCYGFTAHVEGRPIEVLWAAQRFEQGGQRASGSGIPLLFPFPGRIRGTQLQWESRTYELTAGDGRGNAIHGFVHERPWRVTASSPREATGEFQASVDDPSVLDRWPADFRIRATYSLDANTLAARIEMENPDSRPLPCGLGAHPYFCTPLGGASGDDCIVTLPAAKRWEMVDMIATGKLLDVDADTNLAGGKRFGETTLDNGFSQLAFRDGWCAGSIFDPGSGLTMTIRFDDALRECVVYNPPHREAICIEPYSCICDPFRLAQEGIDAGLRVLAPGEKWTARFSIELAGEVGDEQ